MSDVDRLEELVERLHGAIGQLEEAQEVVGEAGIEIRNELERLQRASSGKWDGQIIALNNDLNYLEFRPPISIVRAYTEADNMDRLCNWIREFEQPEEPDVAS